MQFSDSQISLIHRNPFGSCFLKGPAGTGKTTVGTNWLLHLLEEGVLAENILVLVPQRTLAFPYYQVLNQPDLPPGGIVTVVTLGGLAQRLIGLFWPLIAGPAGFSHPERTPVFLTLETAQYYMSRLVSPLLGEGFFDSISIDRNRLFSQILDNLNKAAAVGFNSATIANRLKTAWVGGDVQNRIYEDAQECANRFRSFCLENNLLDFSLQLEVFSKHLWPSQEVRSYLQRQFRHLIYDNIEEDIPIAHDIISEWFPEFDSVLLIYDTGGGYRSFLGADPESAERLEHLCQQSFELSQSWVSSAALLHLQNALSDSIYRREFQPDPQIQTALSFSFHKFIPQMIEWIADQVHSMVYDQGVPPAEIAILAPFLSDSLRFTITNRLELVKVPSRSHRPSRSLREEPATRCLLTLVRLAHPTWNLLPTPQDVRYAFMQSIHGMDLVRADLLTRIVYRPRRMVEVLGSFDQINPDMQERITYRFGERYEFIRNWIAAYQQGEPLELDIFLSKLFGEVLSQPGFGFADAFDSAAVTARLIESVQKFRRVTTNTLIIENRPVGQEYLRMVDEGVVAAQYLQSWQEPPTDAVLLAPAYTFLMMNRPTSIQFWLDVGSLGWWERLYQPLTHPVVLSRRWPQGRTWNDSDEYQYNQTAMEHLVTGLIRRCRSAIILCSTNINEQGDEQRGPLLFAVQKVLRRLNNPLENSLV